MACVSDWSIADSRGGSRNSLWEFVYERSVSDFLVVRKTKNLLFL